MWKCHCFYLNHLFEQVLKQIYYVLLALDVDAVMVDSVSSRIVFSSGGGGVER